MAKRKSYRSPGARFRRALELEEPLQIPGVINAYAARLAERAGFRAIYLSGAGVANGSYGLSDTGITRLDDVLIDVRRIAGATELPLLVDADTGWSNPAKTVREMARAGAAGIHLEDQIEAKRCGHLGGKKLVRPANMVARIKAACRARDDADFIVMARTDAYAVEGPGAAIERARAYREAGADMIFAEALPSVGAYREFIRAVRAPVLANITEFGKTPLLSVKQLRRAGVAMALYPLSAFRAMNAAALEVYHEVRKRGTQAKLLSRMQTRAELYKILGYEAKS